MFLRSAYHDIPWEEPELIRAGTRRAAVGAPGVRKENGLRCYSLAGIRSIRDAGSSLAPCGEFFLILAT